MKIDKKQLVGLEKEESRLDLLESLRRQEALSPMLKRLIDICQRSRVKRLRKLE